MAKTKKPNINWAKVMDWLLHIVKFAIVILAASHV
jgi:hypothetical protein